MFALNFLRFCRRYVVKFAIYNSRSLSKPFDDMDMDILRASVTFNAAHDITGFLHRSARHYYQCLEGPGHHIDELLARIAKDPRHTGFHLLQSGNTDQRRFGSWSMGYSQIARAAQTAPLTPDSSGQEVSQILHQEALRQQAATPSEDPA